MIRSVLRRPPIYAVAQLAVVVAWFVFMRPAALGGPASYVIVSGTSMEPTLSGGDFVFALRQDAYSTGDLVAFRVPAGEPGEGAAVIHRIVGWQGERFITQGDNSDQPDTWHPGSQDVLGRVMFSLPGGGRLIGWFRQPVVLGAIAGVLGMSFVLVGGKPRRPVSRPTAVRPPVDEPRPHEWDRLLVSEPGASGSDFLVPPSRLAPGRLVPGRLRHDRAVPAKDLLRGGQMNRRAVLRHPLPPKAEVFVVHSGNQTHWIVSERGEVLSKKAQEDGES